MSTSNNMKVFDQSGPKYYEIEWSGPNWTENG